MPFPTVDVQPGPKCLSAALLLAGFSDTTVYLPSVTDKCGVTWTKPTVLQIALAVVGGESTGHAWAYHNNLDIKGNVLSTDYGLMQLNAKAHPEMFAAVTSGTQPNWANYYDNCVVAYEIFQAGTLNAETVKQETNSFKPWNAYNNGGYLSERFGGRSWMDWASYGINQMHELVNSLMEAPAKLSKEAALQEVASINWDKLEYWTD